MKTAKEKDVSPTNHTDNAEAEKPPKLALRRERAVALAGPIETSVAVLDRLEVLPARSGPPNPDAEMGEQLTAQYQRATGGMVEVIKFGALMMSLEATLSARGHSGHGKKGDGVKGWLAEHAPGVNRQTAYRFKAVTESVATEYVQIVGAKIAQQFALPDLVTTPTEQLPANAQAKQLLLFDFVSGTSQRSWLDRFRPAESKGGNTYERGNGKGDRKPLTPEQAQALLHGMSTGAAQSLDAVLKEAAYTVLTPAELDQFALRCKQAAEAAEAWQKMTLEEREQALADRLKEGLRLAKAGPKEKPGKTAKKGAKGR